MSHCWEHTSATNTQLPTNQKYLIYMKAIQDLQEALLPLPAPNTPLLTLTSYIWNFIPGLPTCSSNTWSVLLSQLPRSPMAVCGQQNTIWQGRSGCLGTITSTHHSGKYNTVVIPYLLPFIYFKNAIRSWSFGNFTSFSPLNLYIIEVIHLLPQLWMHPSMSALQ